MKIIRVRIADKYDKKGYKFYVVTPQMKILSGWEYQEDAKDSLEEWKEFKPSSKLKIYKKAELEAKGIKLDDDSIWQNRP